MSATDLLQTEVYSLYNNIKKNDIVLPQLKQVLSSELKFTLQNLSSKEVTSITSSLNIYNQIISDSNEVRKIEPERNKRHLKAFLEKFNLKVSKEIFNHLSDDVILEIYSKENRQLFRTINFFKTCNYDFYTLTFTPWDELFYRSNSVTKKIFSAISTILQNNIEYTSHTGIPAHIITDKNSGKKVRYESIGAGATYCDSTQLLMGYASLIKVIPITTQLSSL